MNYKVIPILRIFDYNKAIEFYIDFLGFTITWENKPSNAPVYIEIAKEEIVLHLSEHHGDCCPGAKVYIQTERDLRTFHGELLAKNYMYNKPALEIAPWNALTMEVVDPFNNKLLFAQPLPKTHTV